MRGDSAFYVGAAVKPFDRNESEPIRALPGLELDSSRFASKVPSLAPIPGSSFRWQLPWASGALRLVRPSIRAGLLASHQMLRSLQGDLGSFSVYAPSNGRFLFETRRLAAGVSHQLETLLPGPRSGSLPQINRVFCTAPSGMAPVSR